MEKDRNRVLSADKAGFRVYSTLLVKFVSWIMVVLSLFTLIMEILGAYRIYRVDIFTRPKTLVVVLFVNFAVWFIRSFLESFIYPSYKTYMFLFLILTITSGYLLTTKIF